MVARPARCGWVCQNQHCVTMVAGALWKSQWFVGIALFVRSDDVSLWRGRVRVRAFQRVLHGSAGDACHWWREPADYRARTQRQATQGLGSGGAPIKLRQTNGTFLKGGLLRGK